MGLKNYFMNKILSKLKTIEIIRQVQSFSIFELIKFCLILLIKPFDNFLCFVYLSFENWSSEGRCVWICLGLREINSISSQSQKTFWRTAQGSIQNFFIFLEGFCRNSGICRILHGQHVLFSGGHIRSFNLAFFLKWLKYSEIFN